MWSLVSLREWRWTAVAGRNSAAKFCKRYSVRSTEYFVLDVDWIGRCRVDSLRDGPNL